MSSESRTALEVFSLLSNREHGLGRAINTRYILERGTDSILVIFGLCNMPLDGNIWLGPFIAAKPLDGRLEIPEFRALARILVFL